jgi:hypothetical protein
MSTDTNSPKLTIQNLSILAGQSQQIKDGLGGLAVSFFFSPAFTLGNTLRVIFGPTGNEFDLSGFNGAFIRLGGPVDEITIRNAGGATATGQLVTSPCDEFLIMGM